MANRCKLAWVTGSIQQGGDRQQARLEMDSGFRNSDLLLPAEAILTHIQAVQVRQNLPVSDSLKQTKVSPVNLDIEMETGTGKTYCYIKTVFELNKRYGWCKFIVVVPSIAIRKAWPNRWRTLRNISLSVRKADPFVRL